MTPRGLALAGVIGAGLGALALQGPPLSGVAATAAALCGVALPLHRFVRGLPTSPWAISTGVVLLILVVGAARGTDPAVLLGGLLAYLQVHRRWTGRGPGDDRISVLLAALMLVASGGADVGPLFLPVVVLWALCLPATLLPERGGPPAAPVALGVATAVLAAAVFTVVPRPGTARVGSTTSRVELTGFAPAVELGAMDALLDDPTIVFRAQLSPAADGPVYWRGIALDTFDGRRWTSTLPPEGRAELLAPTTPPAGVRFLEVVREPMPEGLLFVPGRPVAVDADGATLARDPHGAWYASTTGRLRYRAMVLPPLAPGAVLQPEETANADVLVRTRQLPSDLRAALEPLASQIAGERPAAEQLDRLVAYLRNGFRYTRRPADAAQEEPLLAFLFGTQEGHCEYFASALAVLARARGLPARVVNGFVTVAPADPEGWLTVRRHHAHSWVEVHLPGQGWVAVDATPGPGAPASEASWGWWEAAQAWWVDRFLPYDGGDQVAWVLTTGRAAESLLPGIEPAAVPWRGLGIWLVGSVGVAGLAWGLARRRRLPSGRSRDPAAGPVARIHRRARHQLQARGIVIPAQLPPVAAAEWFAAHHPGAPAEALLALAWLHYEVALGGASPVALVSRARALANRVVVVRFE